MGIYFAVFCQRPPLYIKAGPGPAPGFSRDSVPRFHLFSLSPSPFFSSRVLLPGGAECSWLLFPFIGLAHQLRRRCACHTPPQNLPPAAFLGKSNTGVHLSRWGLQVGGRCRRRRTGRESMRNMPPCRCDFMVTVWSRGWWAFTPCVKWLAHAHECRLGPTGCQVSRCGLFGVGQGSPRLLRPRSYKFHWQDNIRTRVTGSQPFIGTLSPLANPPSS